MTNPPAAEATRVDDVVRTLEGLAPTALAEDWDNVGLIVGDRRAPLDRVTTCLTLTPDVAAEAIAAGAGLVVSHHPVLFRGTKRLTSDSAEGRMLLDLVRAGVAVYSPHTGYDSAADGINEQLAARFGLQNVQPIRPTPAPSDDELSALGAGRFGTLAEPTTLNPFVTFVAHAMDVEHLQFVGDDDRKVRRVAVACGSAGEFLDDAVRLGCDVFVTGETRFHTCLEARTSGVGLVLLGHYASERPALETLAERIAERHPGLAVEPSRVERDPIRWV